MAYAKDTSVETEMGWRPADALDRRPIVQSYMRDGMTKGEAVQATRKLVERLNLRARALSTKRQAALSRDNPDAPTP